MARMTIGQKAERVLQFLVGLASRRARRALARHGFTQADVEDGWERLKALSNISGAPDGDGVDRELLRDLDAWENVWFPVVDIALRTNFPSVRDAVLRNLRQSERAEVVVSVSTLVARIDAMARTEDEGGLGDEGAAARALLARRGLTDAVVAEARALLARIGSSQEAPSDDVEALDREVRAAAEQRMWSWYLEWSGIARIVITDGRVLRSLGFRRNERKGGSRE